MRPSPGENSRQLLKAQAPPNIAGAGNEGQLAAGARRAVKTLRNSTIRSRLPRQSRKWLDTNRILTSPEPWTERRRTIILPIVTLHNQLAANMLGQIPRTFETARNKDARPNSFDASSQ